MNNNPPKVIRGNAFTLKIALDTIEEGTRVPVEGTEWKVRLYTPFRSFDIEGNVTAGVFKAAVPANLLPPAVYALEAKSANERWAVENAVEILEFAPKTEDANISTDTVEMHAITAACIIDEAQYNSRVCVGSTLKVRLGLGVGTEYRPEELDFTVEFVNNDRRVSFTRQQCINDNGRWYVLLPTALLGVGKYQVQARYNLTQPERPVIVRNSTDIEVVEAL